ncbi:putative cytochrome P450 oxidoreductase [Xylogone sp. PMI_703]|nr:putative cytochrome P450 oxidoreductase [Xylogone sp. PMI_703]
MEFKVQILLLAVLIFILVNILRTGRRPRDYPPGPPTLPVLGNIHLMPKHDAHKQFRKWAEQYGPVYSLILGTKTLIVLTSDQAVKDLLDKRSAIYSHRQDMYLGMTLCSGGLRMLMMGYTAKWRMIRKMVHSLLNVSAARSYVPYQMLENRQMLHELLVEPEQFIRSIQRYSNSLTTSMVFGWRTPTYDNEDIQQFFSGFEQFAIVNQTGTAAIVDYFPLLRRLPDWLLSTQKKAKDLHKREKELYLRHWLNCKQIILDGTAKPCFCVNMAKMQQEEGFDDDQAAYISGTLLEAGSDTTSSTLVGFIQAMVLFPEVQKKAQAEIDKVVGDQRLPTMDDEPNLRYISSCVKESLRWMPTTILGAVPHAVIQDDYYMNYRIPAGAGVLNNVWGIHQDENRYPEPRRFNPDRFKDYVQNAAESASNPDASKRDHFTFGAGRRICPGIHVAERSLFLGISRLLWAFDITSTTDTTGKQLLPDQDHLTQGFVCMPEPFKCRIVARSAARARIIEEEWEEAQKQLNSTTKQWEVIPDGLALPTLSKNLVG